MNQRPIGVFDSGLGGLTAVRQLRRLMPSEDIIYFGDTSRVPYGNRSRKTILKYARQDTRFLRSFDLKAIVIACGTVSSNCLTELRAENDIPMIGVVEPAVQRALAVTRNHKIGVAATRATISSGAFAAAFGRSMDYLDFQLFSKPCPLFVPLVEEGRCRPGDPVIEQVAEEYLRPLRDNGIDTLVLGCTHYPLLAGVIGQVMGPDVTLVDSGAESAAALQTLLAGQNALACREQGSARFYTSDSAADFQRLASLFLGEALPVQAEQIDITAY
ncbi:MAG: glutamate racemase [Oscillospiraceae bacterium]|nr:glutamate racemase [Oscillospiraceae bacterium]